MKSHCLAICCAVGGRTVRVRMIVVVDQSGSSVPLGGGGDLVLTRPWPVP